MKIITLILCLMIAGCSFTNSDLKQEEQSNENLIEFINDQTVNEKNIEEVQEILEPLLEGIYLENKMIQGATYQEGMTIEDLRVFLLQYYTEEIANETCDLIIYKSQLGHGTDYSGMYFYDEETDIFYLEESNYLDEIPNDPKITIEDISIQTEDRIEIVTTSNWRVLTETPTMKNYTRIITLEREGNDWYLGDLVLSRGTINEANREYRNR